MTKTAQELADEAKHCAELYAHALAGQQATGLVPPQTLIDRLSALHSAIDALLSLAQASQARTDGGAVAWHENARKALQGAVTGVIDTRKLEAIRICRAATGCSLKQARMAIEEMQATLATPPGNATQAAGAQWISVEDRMPAAGTECLVWVKALSQRQSGPTHYAYVTRWDEQHEAPVSFSSVTIPVGLGWDDFDYEDVTHWMPLPASPAAELKKD